MGHCGLCKSESVVPTTTEPLHEADQPTITQRNNEVPCVVDGMPKESQNRHVHWDVRDFGAVAATGAGISVGSTDSFQYK